MKEKVRLRRKPLSTTDALFEKAARYLPAAPVIVEAGAADGADAEQLARLFRDGHVHAIEPEPSAYTETVRRTSRLPNVTAWNLALGTTDEPVTLHVSSGPYGTMSSSLLEPAEHLQEMPFVAFDTDVLVQQRTLQSWADRAGVERVDLLALDLQGMEARVLAASPDLASRASVVISETFTNEKFVGNETVLDLQQTLVGLGFVIIETNMQWHNSGDLIAVNHRWFS